MPIDLRTSSISPFTAVDSAKITQKIKVVETGTEENPLIAGYSYIEATGSTFDYISSSLNRLNDISSSLSNINDLTITADLGNLDDTINNSLEKLQHISSSTIKIEDNTSSSVKYLIDLSSSVLNNNLAQISSLQNINNTITSIKEHIKDIPTKIYKKRISDDASYSSKIPLIVWENNLSGTFRICEQNFDRKYVTIYNDSNYDLFISVANDDNPQISIDFDDSNDLNSLVIKYSYTSASVQRTLFEYKLDDFKDIYSYHTHSSEPTNKYGYNKACYITNLQNKANLKIFLTPDFLSQNINKHIDPLIETGSYEIYLSNSSGITTPIQTFNLSSSLYDNEYIDRSYKIYTRISGNTFLDSTFFTGSEKLTTLNGFNMGSVPSDFSAAPEEYSYIVFKDESVIISEKEATLPLFGFIFKPTDGTNIAIRVTEAI